MVLESPLWPYSGIGLLTTIYVFFKLSEFVYLHFLRSTSISRYQHKPGVWALVTGTSDGIGYAFAEELSQRGFNIILHGRNPTKLNNVKADLNRFFPRIKIRTFIADVTKDSITPITDLVAEINELPLNVLVNNVGGTKGFVPTDFKTFYRPAPKKSTPCVKLTSASPPSSPTPSFPSSRATNQA
ncbi:hypothetical protein MMC14_005014 [Varicellaria rhodocarpa]|nr:hypothetical protein [Varicellaria rhodocarpa]